MYKSKAEELSEIIGNTTIKEFNSSMEIAYEIYLIKRKEIDDFRWIIASIYQAAKIEGIRQERKRRNSKKTINSSSTTKGVC